MSKPSRKHHYLPRHYLRGFTDGAGTFFVYDKLTGKIFHTKPDAAFFENNLNTVTLPNGSSSDFLESLYAQMEAQAWNSLDNIRNSSPYAPVHLWDKMELFLFLSFLHWRLPSNAPFAEELSQRFFGPNEKLWFFNLKSRTGAPVPQEAIDRIRTSPAWKKAAKATIPFAPFYQGPSWCADLVNWRFSYPADDCSWHLVGDNPIIIRGCNDHNPATCLKEFVFPVSARIVLISCGEHLGKRLPAEFIIQLGTAMIERSQRFVACHDRSFLEALVSDHELHVRFGKTDRIIPELFQMLRDAEER